MREFQRRFPVVFGTPSPEATFIPEKLLIGQTAIITGAAGDIGSVISQTLARSGATVILNGRQKSERAEQLLHQIEEEGGEAFFYSADVADEGQIAKLVANVIASYGKVDILVNNAGIIGNGSIEEMSLSEWERVMRTNLTGPFLMMRAVVPHMKQRRSGKIINISSLAGVVGVPGLPAYSASKGGLNLLTKEAAAELGPYGIRVNAIAPGFVESDMAERIPRIFRGLVKMLTPERRMIQTEEVARHVLFYASDLSIGTNGHVHTIDAGLTRT